MRPGQSFESEEVASYYKYRPDYHDDLFAKLHELSPRHTSALDLGCGTGKIARRICGMFGTVTAVDASNSMLNVARQLQHPTEKNIKWMQCLAEEADFSDARFDLIIAAASIHWMDHALLFPKLLGHVSEEHVIAIVQGDEAHEPPWKNPWDDFLSKWVYLLTGVRYEPNSKQSTFAKKMERHRDWLSLEGDASFEEDFSQSVDDFILCQYSRDTFAPSRLGNKIDEFSAELGQVLSPYADNTGKLTYRVQSKVEWGKIRPTD